MRIVICGSMTASKEMVEAEQVLLRAGHTVVLPAFAHEFAKRDTPEAMHTESVADKVEHDLIREYFKTISEHDAILVMNIERKGVAGYVGGNTFLEMGFAFVLRKPIYLLNAIPEISYRDEIEAMRPIVLNGDLMQIR